MHYNSNTVLHVTGNTHQIYNNEDKRYDIA